MAASYEDNKACLSIYLSIYLSIIESRDPLLYTILSPKLKSAIVTGSYHLPCLTLMVKGLYITTSLSVQEDAGY